MLALIRLTYGYGKKTDRISAGQVGKIAGLSRRRAGDVIRQLEARDMLTIERQGERKTAVIGIQKDPDRWRTTSPLHRKSDPKGGVSDKQASAPNGGVTSDPIGG